jgi:hypothetical protein
MARPLSFPRLTLGLSSFALVLGAVACSSAPGDGPTGKGDQAMGIVQPPSCNSGYTKVCDNFSCNRFCQPELSTETYWPNWWSPPDHGCSASTIIGVPPELAQYGCTLGVDYYPTSDPFYYVHLWACPSWVPAPTRVTGDEFQSPPTFSVHTTFNSGCVGGPVSGWELIEEDPPEIGHPCPQGCPAPPVGPL